MKFEHLLKFILKFILSNLILLLFLILTLKIRNYQYYSIFPSHTYIMINLFIYEIQPILDLCLVYFSIGFIFHTVYIFVFISKFTKNNNNNILSNREINKYIHSQNLLMLWFFIIFVISQLWALCLLIFFLLFFLLYPALNLAIYFEKINFFYSKMIIFDQCVIFTFFFIILIFLFFFIYFKL